MIKFKLAQFMEEIFLFEFDQEVTESTDLFKVGIIDSYGYIKLIKRIEDDFNIEFSEIELMHVEASLAGLSEKVQKKISTPVV